jgi:hypothetical protein
MGPQNYTLSNAPDPGQSFLQGLQSGEQRLMLQQQQAVQMQQQQAALQAQQRREEAIQAVLADPSEQNYARLISTDPKNHEAHKALFAPLDEKRKKGVVSDLLQWTAAVENGHPELAAEAMRARADMMERDAGGANPEAQALRAQADVVDANPELAARLYFMPMLYAGGAASKDAIANLTAMREEKRKADAAPVDLRKKEADATTAETTAKYADRQALADLETKGWNIKAIQNDMEVKKQANRIAVMNAQTSRANSELQRQELALKLDEARGKLAEKVREKVATAEAGASSIDNMMNTIARIKTLPGVREVVGSLEGQRFYPTQVAAVANTLNPFTSSGDDRADAIALIDTLGSQAFLAQIPSIKGMGALSNAEGEKLQSAFQNLGRAQSEKQFNATLDEATRLLMKAREGLSKSTGVPLPKPDTPAAPGARPPLESFFDK